MGLRRLQQASASSEVPVRIRWLPYFLSPGGTPKEGIGLRDYYSSKYGDAGLRRYEWYMQPNSPLDQAGAPYNVKFRMDRMVFPTLDCHRLVEWCYSEDGPGASKGRIEL